MSASQILSSFNIPSATSGQVETRTITKGPTVYPIKSVDTIRVPIVPDDPIKLDRSLIPDFVYNEAGAGYAAMLSPKKIGLVPTGEMIILPK